MSEFDPFFLSRELERLWARASAVERSLQAGVPSPSPFLRADLPGKLLRDEISALPSGDPMRAGLLRWHDVLLELRVNIEATRLEAASMFEELHPPITPLDAPTSLAVLQRQLVLALVQGKDELSESLYRGLLSRVGRVSSIRRERFARTRELVERLGEPLSPLLCLEEPVPTGTQDASAKANQPVMPRDHSASFLVEPAPVGESAEPSDLVLSAANSTSESLRAFCQRVLSETEEPFFELSRAGYLGFLHASLGTDAGEGWPARLTPDTISQLLGGDWLTRGLSVTGVRLAERLAPASFLSSTEQLCQAVGWASAPRDLPFVVAHHPAGIEGRVLGQILSQWMLSPDFVRRRLQLSSDAARRTQRALWLLGCATHRLRAVRCQCLLAARSSGASLDHTYASAADRLGGDLGPTLGLVPVPPSSDVELCAGFLGVQRFSELRNTHDEDFVDNPRARDQLRSELGRPEQASVQVSQLHAGLREFLSGMPPD